jgi:hypothetical protein
MKPACIADMVAWLDFLVLDRERLCSKDLVLDLGDPHTSICLVSFFRILYIAPS